MKTIQISEQSLIQLFNLITLTDTVINPNDLILNVELESNIEGETTKIDLNQILSEISDGIKVE